MAKHFKYLIFPFLALFSLCFLLPTTATAQARKAGITKVVLDAGHGGHDPGTESPKYKYKEKDINLAVVLRLGKLINKHYPDVEVIYTRKSDVFVGLADRGIIANKADADLFISVHVNGAHAASAGGVETLVMGLDKNGQNLDVAMRENDVIIYEDDYETKYEGFQTGSPESYIMFSMMQYTHQGQSLIIADMVQTQMSKNTDMRNRGVKQAPVLVLWRTSMPSILTEFGFLSNPSEASFIGSEKGRDMYATCIFNAFSQYKSRVDGSTAIITLNASDIAAAPAGYSGVQAREATPAAPAGGAVYRIQVKSSVNKIPKNSSEFGPYRGEVKEFIIDGRYKYYTKEASTYKEALFLQGDVRKHIKDAFVVAFVDNKPVTIDEAKRINNEP